jgi:hypothetical protein
VFVRDAVKLAPLQADRPIRSIIVDTRLAKRDRFPDVEELFVLPRFHEESTLLE